MSDHNSSRTRAPEKLAGTSKLWWMIPTLSTLVVVVLFVWGVQKASNTPEDSPIAVAFAPPLASLDLLDNSTTSQISATIDEKVYELELANTREQRIRGLGQRDTLEANSGMLFVFEKADRHGIWMKDMHFAIDIFWLNKAGEVVDYANNVEPDSYPRVFSPTYKAWYVVEIPATSWEPSS